MVSKSRHYLKNPSLLLISIVLIGTLLRLYGLGKHSFWYDEALTLFTAENAPSFKYIPYLMNPPLFPLLVKLWLLLGRSEFFLRLLPAFFGVMSIIITYKISQKLFNEKAGLIAAFIISTAPFHIYYSQELRAYSLVTLLTLLSLYYLIKLLDKDKLRYWFVFILSNVLLVYTHNAALFLLVAENMFFFVFCRKYRKLLRKWLMGQFLIFLLYLPGLIILLAQLRNLLDSNLHFWIPKPSFFVFIQTFRIFNIGYSANSVIYFLSSLLFFPLFFIGIYNKEDIEKNILLLCWLFIPILSAVIISKITPVYLYRTLIYASPAYYIIIAKGITKINFSITRSGILFLYIILLTFTLPNQYQDIFFYPQTPYRTGVPPKLKTKAALQFVEEQFQTGDIVVHTNECTALPFAWYQKGKIRKVRIRQACLILSCCLYPKGHIYFRPHIFEENGIELLKAEDVVKNYNRIWLILSSWEAGWDFRCLDHLSRKIKDWFENNKNIKLINFKFFKGIMVCLYETNLVR